MNASFNQNPQLPNFYLCVKTGNVTPKKQVKHELNGTYVYGGEFKVINNFLDNSHEEIQTLRGNYSLCKVCMENGAHVNWKSDQKGIMNKAININFQLIINNNNE